MQTFYAFFKRGFRIYVRDRHSIDLSPDVAHVLSDMPATIFGPDILVVLTFLLLAIGMPMWTLVDILFRRPEVFVIRRLSKTVWLVLTMGLVLAALFIPLMRIVTTGFCLNYLIRARPTLKFQGGH